MTNIKLWLVIIALLIGSLIYQKVLINGYQFDLNQKDLTIDSLNEKITRHKVELNQAKLVNEHDQKVIKELTALNLSEQQKHQALSERNATEKQRLENQLNQLTKGMENDTSCANQPMPSHVYSLLNQF